MFTQKRMFIVSIVSAIMLVLEAGSSLSNTAQALPLIHVGELNRVTLPYAGSLTNDAGQPVADGAFDFIFMLYATPTDGEALWSETQYGVTVRVGSFTTLLGAVNPIPREKLNDGNRWLAVLVRGPGEADFTTFSPRQHLSGTAPVSATGSSAGSSCAHNHVGETWDAAIAWTNGAFKVTNSLNGPSIWGVNSGGGNALRGDGYGTSLGVYGSGVDNAAIVGRSANANGVEGYGGKFGVKGESTGTFDGVSGKSASGAGVSGYSDAGVGVYGSGALFGVYSNGAATVAGNLYVTGSKSGYVVEIAQNDDTVSLEVGDVVVISGAGPAIMGEIPVVKVRRATDAETNAVVGVVDQHYLPAPSQTRADATMLAKSVAESTAVAPGDYLTLVTLGSFKTIKVDASYGAIKSGDLLVTSPNPGYAMRVASPKLGTIIGKALGTLDSGASFIPVIVTLQ